MLTIRLSRIGKKNKPSYRIIISEKSRDLYGRALEILGSYDTRNKNINVNNERIKYWLNQGAGMSPTVNNLLIEKKIIEGKKAKASKTVKKEESEQASNKTEKKDELEQKKDETLTK